MLNRCRYTFLDGYVSRYEAENAFDELIGDFFYWQDSPQVDQYLSIDRNRSITLYRISLEL